MAGNSKNSLTIFMFPWFAMGHLTPYILTANKLAKRGHKVVIVVPPSAQSKLGSLNRHPGLVQFRPISVPHVDGLPAQAQTTNEVPIYEHHLLFKALDLTRPEIKALLCEIRPDFVFYDLMHWVPGLARELRIMSVHFCVVSPASAGFVFAEGPLIEDLMNGPPGYPPSIKLDKHAARRLTFLDKEIDGGISARQRILTAFCEGDVIGFKTCREIEGPYCDFLENKLKKPILLAGHMVPETQTGTLDEKWAIWLDKFNPKSVIYCAFGSEAILEKDQFQQLLLGIELTGLPFVIALKPPFGFQKIEDAFPEGFGDRTKERGIVHGGWVPQQLILKHHSVGCFVTHCGYGSMWEGLMSECQLVVVPHVADQFVHARLLSGDLKVGVEVERGDEDGMFTKEGVNSAIMAAMQDESGIGMEIRAKHGEIREVLLSKGFEDSYFDGFVEKLRTLLE